MTGARVLTHLPLVRIEGPRAELGGGALFALPFAEYDELLDGSFTDARREYESTAPVFFLTEHAADAPDFARHLTGLARAHDALALAAPSAAIPDPGVSLRILDIAGEPPVTQTQQGDADQELLFLGRMAAYALSAAELERATGLLEVVDRCHGELRWALDELHAAATLSLTRAERLTLCTIALEALLLPELDTQLKATFARRLAHLVGGEDAEALARAIYDARSEAVHGEAGVEAAPGAAERLLAAAVVGLERLTRDGTGLAEIRTRLDEEPAAPPKQPPPLRAPAPGSRVLRAPPRRALPVYSGHTLTRHGLLITDPEIPEGRVVLFAPLHGLALETLPDELIDAGFPLTWMWPSQLAQLEDPDIRRDWMARHSQDDHVVACLAAIGETTGWELEPDLAPLARRLDMAVTALRLAGLIKLLDPGLAGLYAADGSGRRYRRGAVYRQTAIGVTFERPDALDDATVADLAALWSLLLGYEAGRTAPEIDHALALHRRAHDVIGLDPATRLQLLFASLEAALGRGGAGSLEPLAERDPDAFAWYAERGRALRNAVAHGEWEDPGPEDDHHRLSALLGEVLPALLMAWRARKQARPAKTLLAALRDPGADLDWRAAARLPDAPDMRYAGLDTQIMVDRAGMAYADDDLAGAVMWFERASARGDPRGDHGAGRLALAAGDAATARARIGRAVERGLESARGDLGRLERDAGNIEAARHHLRRAVELGDGDALISLGILERAAGNLDEARAIYERAADAGDVRGAYNRGLLEHHAGDPAAALSWFGDAARGGMVDAMGWAGDTSAQLGDLDTARRWWQDAAEHGDEQSRQRLAQLEGG